MKQFMKKFRRRLLSVTAFTLFVAGANAQQKQNYNVAIFLYNNVELLDFAGPGEVFASTNGFHVYTVSADGKEILSQGFVTVKPEYSIDNAPTPDVIVFPGGNTSAVQKDKKVLDWVKKSVADGNTAMSVCSGAGIFQLNVKAYPNSWNAYDSLAEGFLKSGDKKNALTYYQKSLEIDPTNTNAKDVIKTLQ
jgi:tetratricopeptide (TPR) repeat protein